MRSLISNEVRSDELAAGRQGREQQADCNPRQAEDERVEGGVLGRIYPHQQDGERAANPAGERGWQGLFFARKPNQQADNNRVGGQDEQFEPIRGQSPAAQQGAEHHRTHENQQSGRDSDQDVGEGECSFQLKFHNRRKSCQASYFTPYLLRFSRVCGWMGYLLHKSPNQSGLDKLPCGSFCISLYSVPTLYNKRDSDS